MNDVARQQDTDDERHDRPDIANACESGGATLVSSLINAGLIHEVRLLINPVVLGRGKTLFKDVNEQHTVKFARNR